MSERDNWTLEQWKNTAEWVERELRKERAEWRELRERLEGERDMLRYAVKGICAERLSLSVHIDPTVLAQSKDVWDMAQFMVRNHSMRAAYEVEKKLGERYELLQAYDEARQYIHYLQNHAGSRGVSFKQFAERVFR